MSDDHCCNCKFAQPSWIGYMCICKLKGEYVLDDDTCKDYAEKKLQVKVRSSLEEGV